jgi:hypothetical protein
MGKMNASVLLAVTPEYKQIKIARESGAVRCEKRAYEFSIKQTS